MSQPPILANVEFLRGVPPPNFVSLPKGAIRNKAKNIYIELIKAPLACDRDSTIVI